MTVPNLLDHPSVQCVLTDPSTRYWLRDLLTSAALRDPVDTLADLDAARAFVGSYVQQLLGADAALSTQEKPEGL